MASTRKRRAPSADKLLVHSSGFDTVNVSAHWRSLSTRSKSSKECARAPNLQRPKSKESLKLLDEVKPPEPPNESDHVNRHLCVELLALQALNVVVDERHDIPCFMSRDELGFFADLTKLKKATDLSKAALMKLAETAEAISPACQRLIFLTDRQDESYDSFRRMFAVIDACRMDRVQIAELVPDMGVIAATDFELMLTKFGVYSLKI